MTERRSLPPLAETSFGREKLPAESTVAESREQLKQLRGELRAASKADENDRAEEIRGQITEINSGLREKAQAALEARDEKLEEVEDFDSDERLKFVDRFRDLLHDLQVTRKRFRETEDGEDKKYWGKKFVELKGKMDKTLDTPSENLQLEKAYVAWTKSRAEYARFLILESRLASIDQELEEPVVKGGEEVSDRDMARLGRIAGRRVDESVSDVGQDVEALRWLYKSREIEGEKSEELDALTAELEGVAEVDYPARKSRAELEDERNQIVQRLNEIWEDDEMIRYHEGLRQLEKLLDDLNAGVDVLETPSVISGLNQLAEWEKLHQRTTIGGVLVGEPGTGKTTQIHHYLQEKGRNYVYLDMSEEVTRYMLFGTKALEFKSQTDYFGELTEQIGAMDEKQFQTFISKNAKTVAETYGLEGKEAEATFFRILQEELAQAEEVSDDELKGKLKEAQTMMEGKVAEKYNEELAKKFKHLVQKNGWRDGVMIAALRRGDSVIIDEFVKSRDLTQIFGLTTAKPGEKWYFEDNDEEIDIPDHWRMYFTANIGRKHGGYKVAEALASRAQGKVREVTFPPTAEELTVGLAEICDAEGVFLRAKEDIAKTAVLIGDVFPKIRELLKGKESIIPISWRTIRDIGEKLVTTKEIHGQNVKQRTRKSFDDAVYDVLVESYKLYEDKSVPKEVVNICTSFGLMLDDKLKKKIVDQEEWLTEDEWQKRQDARDDKTATMEDIVKVLKGEMAMTRAFMTEERPERKLKAVA